MRDIGVGEAVSVADIDIPFFFIEGRRASQLAVMLLNHIPIMIRHEVQSDLPIPPGEYLAEVIAELGMTKDELASTTTRLF